MKKLLLLAGVAIAIAGCTTEQSTGESIDVNRSTLSVDGVNRGELTSALMVLSDVRIVADGKTTSGTIENAKADLARGEEKLGARLAGLPASGEVEVQIQFDDFGGYSTGDEAGSIDTRGALVRFKARAEDLRQRGALVSIDLSRSVPTAVHERRAFVPHFDVR